MRRADNGGPSNYELLCFEVAAEDDLPPEFVDAFIEQHERDCWTAVNPATGEVEHIRDISASLRAFCHKLERDRGGS